MEPRIVDMDDTASVLINTGVKRLSGWVLLTPYSLMVKAHAAASGHCSEH